MILTSSMMGINENAMIDETAGIKPADYSNYGIEEACYQMMMEDATNWNNLTKAIALKEMTYFQENGVEIVYEAFEIKKIVGQATETIKKWFSKVMGVLQSAMTRVSATLANITKTWGPNIKKLKDGMKFPDDKRFEDYNYAAANEKISAVHFLYEDAAENPFTQGGASAAARGNNSDKVSSTVEDFVKKNCDGDTCTANAIKTKYLGAKVKIGGDVYSTSMCAEAVTGFKAGIKSINEMKNGAKKVVNQMIKDLKAAEKSERDGMSKEDKKNAAKELGNILAIVSKVNGINSALLTAKLSIMVGYLNQAKKCTGIYLAANKNMSKDQNQTQTTGLAVRGEGAFEDFGYSLI